jgi:pimeloyl-ACP methyl ester carboxylesterase
MNLAGCVTTTALRRDRPKPTGSIAVSEDGTKLFVQEWGNPTGPAILFVHAWSQSRLAWMPQVTGALAKTYRMVAFDHRGHGDSDKPTDIAAYANNDVWADDIAAVMAAMSLRKPILVGW